MNGEENYNNVELKDRILKDTHSAIVENFEPETEIKAYPRGEILVQSLKLHPR